MFGIWPDISCMTFSRVFWTTSLVIIEVCQYRYLLAHSYSSDLFDLMDCFSTFMGYIKFSIKISVFWWNERWVIHSSNDPSLYYFTNMRHEWSAWNLPSCFGEIFSRRTRISILLPLGKYFTRIDTCSVFMREDFKINPRVPNIRASNKSIAHFSFTVPLFSTCFLLSTLSLNLGEAREAWRKTRERNFTTRKLHVVIYVIR